MTKTCILSAFFSNSFIRNEMLQKETVTAHTLELLKSLMQDEKEPVNEN